MAETTFMGVPREKIPWFPTIDYDKCTFCMECDAFCPHRVFERRENCTRLVVANADIAQSMARDFGRKYEELHATGELLTKLLLARQSTDEVLVVPPHHETAFDPLNKTLTAVPIWESENARGSGVQHLVFDDPGTGDQADRSAASAGRLGLGIDAGGTYTDVVIYDFQGHQVLQKAKALTTKWDFTIGIEQALDQLDRSSLTQIDVVAISTTLATNAVVEGRGQTAGLIIMPPYGLFDPPDILYRPIAILDAKMEIDGTEISPVRPDQVRAVVRRLVEQDGVTAFAVTGYASHVNPAHELQVKAIIQQETGLTVTCGHEVSDGVNYRVRATTAALNARIIPCLEALLDDVQRSLRCRDIGAPVMVVRSDGSLMNIESARLRPIETILSGPAASVAGASYLSRATNALVVDIGGTTTDTAVIKNGVVRTCAEGARVGDWQTHVHALRMRTIGLGGDSIVAFEQRRLRIGPQRVAPVSWLVARHPASVGALPWLEQHLDHFQPSTRAMDLVMRNGRTSPVHLDQDESAILAALEERPMSVHELTARLNRRSWNLLDLDRLEDHYLIQRCALTPTDLLHATGQLQLWDEGAARRFADLVARLQNIDLGELARQVMDQIVRMLAVELFKTQLDEEINPDGLQKSPVAMAMINNLLDGGNSDYRVRVQLHRPIIGIGAPAHLFLPQAAQLLETEAILPLHADVANAIGAITSPVCVRHQLEISPTESETLLRRGTAQRADLPQFRRGLPVQPGTTEDHRPRGGQSRGHQPDPRRDHGPRPHCPCGRRQPAVHRSRAGSPPHGPPRPHSICLVSVFGLRPNMQYKMFRDAFAEKGMDVKRDMTPLDIRDMTTEEAIGKVEAALHEMGVEENG